MTRSEHGKVMVSERALIQRLNRHLKDQGQMVKKPRSESVIRDAGQFYILNINRNWIEQPHVDLEALGRKLKVLEPWEELEH